MCILPHATHASIHPSTLYPSQTMKATGQLVCTLLSPVLFFVHCTLHELHATIVWQVQPKKSKNQKAAANKMQNVQQKNGKSEGTWQIPWLPHRSPISLPLSLSLWYLWHAVWCTAAFKMVWQSFFHIIDCLLD